VAADGLFDAMYRGAIPLLPTCKIVEHRFHRLGITKSFENCWVATHGTRIVGGFNACPMDDEGADLPDPLYSQDRHHLTDAFEHLHAPGSFHLNILAVIEEYRGQGIGTKLLCLARSRAQDIGLREHSLIVFDHSCGNFVLISYAVSAARPTPRAHV
jgi:GNAT superfamily N-acetyltransferase